MGLVGLCICIKFLFCSAFHGLFLQKKGRRTGEVSEYHKLIRFRIIY